MAVNVTQSRSQTSQTDYARIDSAVHEAEAATAALFGSNTRVATFPNAADVIQALKSDPRLKLTSKEDILGEPLTKLAAQYGLTRSRGKELFLFLLSAATDLLAIAHQAKRGRCSQLVDCISIMNVYQRSVSCIRVILKITVCLFYEVERTITLYWPLTNNTHSVILIWISAKSIFHRSQQAPHRVIRAASAWLLFPVTTNHLCPDMESPSLSPTMSFPAILRNPGLASHYVHLLAPLDTARRRKAEGSCVREKEGKRRMRRRENGAIHWLPS